MTAPFLKPCVTGASGFIGRNLVAALAERLPASDVRLLCRQNPAVLPLAGADVRICGLDDQASLQQHLDGCDVVFHLMSGSVPSTSNADPLRDIEVNLQGSLRLLEACSKAGVGRVVFASSGGTVYGRLERQPVPEEHPTWPLCSHAIVKLAIERYLHLHHELRGLDYAILRISNPYGPHQATSGIQGVVATFIARMMRSDPIEIWGDGSVVRDFIYVGDVVQALLDAALMPRHKSGTYNVGSGVGTSINELISGLGRAGLSGKVVYRQGRPFDVPVSVLDISRIRRELGWRPGVGLDEGLRRTVAWFREHDQLERGKAVRHGRY